MKSSTSGSINGELPELGRLSQHQRQKAWAFRWKWHFQHWQGDAWKHRLKARKQWPNGQRHTLGSISRRSPEVRVEYKLRFLGRVFQGRWLVFETISSGLATEMWMRQKLREQYLTINAAARKMKGWEVQYWRQVIRSVSIAEPLVRS